jgi:chorismate mutase/prephenate dehydratase
VREKEILEKGAARVTDPQLREHYVRFLQNNMDVSKDYQRQLLEGMRVAYSGVEGAFAHIAAGEIFPDTTLVGYPNFAAAYKAVLQGDCSCAVLPLPSSRLRVWRPSERDAVSISRCPLPMLPCCREV